MHGEFMGVWEETWREIWLPLINEPLSETEESIPEDIFCELYRELAKGLKKPTNDGVIVLLLKDAVTLKEAFELSVRRANRDLTLEQVNDAFIQSGATELTGTGERRTVVEAALTTLLGQPSASLMDAQFQELARDPMKVKAANRRALEGTINDQQKSREAFENTKAEDFAGERALVGFLESAQDTLKELGGLKLSDRYFKLLEAFIGKFSLRYDLCPPCILCPTLPGVFASLVRDLSALTAQDCHLALLMKEYEESVQDLRIDCSERRIKTCIQKQINLLEALGRTYPKVKRKTLGAIANQIASWPHEEVRTALQSLYGFTCDYPGIRHGGTRENAMRAIDMRDMVAMSILLVGFTPYLSDRLNADQVYRGA